ncbi:ABC transporter ATP-binding protein [Leuconostoc palmae]|uniref:ABC transporter ATP-binding protein n=1 Tax=Leuconostoc palmae TaxID=501487 RepID=UPI001C7DB7A3|nr:ABC transporter ATP-binding protein [Leuconostoc palmae]
MQILKEQAKPYRRDIFFSILAVVIMSGAALWQPKLLQYVMTAIINNDKNDVTIYGVELISLAIIGLIAGVTNTIFAAKISQGIAADLRERQYKKIQSFSFGNVEQFSAGNLVVRMTNDVNQVQQLVMTLLQTLTRIPILFIGSFILAILTIPRLWWIVVLMIVLIVLSSQMIFKRMGKYFGRIQKLIDKTNTLAKENLQGVRVVKSFNQEDNEIKRFVDNSNDLTATTTMIGYLFSTLIPMFMLISYIGIGTAIYFVGQGVVNHPSDLAAITSFISYLMQILFAFMIGGLTSTFASRGFISIGRIKEVLDTKIDLSYDINAEKTDLKGSISFKNVTFNYPNDDLPSLKNISFDIEPGEMIGIVGATGSGKSTLAQLIPRLYDPSEGEVFVSGINLKSINEDALRETVSYVLQKSILFSGRISDNIRQGKKDATQEEIRKAADIAQATEFIEQYEDGFEHMVEERSANLSGGQKQRLSIARGVVGRPKILILDDSTSALDAKSEVKVREAINKELKGTTTIVIAEKISSVIHANRILVLDKGELVGIGSHQELLQTSTIYAEIYQTQKAKGDKER